MRSVFFRGAALVLLTLATTLVGFRASGQTIQLTTPTNFWKFNDTFSVAPGLDGTGWELPGYVENAADGWKDGIALFGNDGAGVYDGAGSPWAGLGLNGFFTPLLRNAGGSRATYYFRTKFNWVGPTANVSLNAMYVVDDGFVIYLNGVEAYRAFVPAAPAPITFDTLGSNHDPEGTRFDVPIPSDQLVTGENTIAVRVQQSGTGSSDVSFSFALRGIIPYRPIILTNSEPADRTVLQTRSTTLNAYADASPPIGYQWFFKPIGGAFGPILDATNTSYSILSMQSTDEGDYFCTISNPLGSIDTRTARVTYTEDNLEPGVTLALGSGGQDRVVVEFTERVQFVDSLGNEGSALDEFNYSVDGAGGPLGVALVEGNPGGSSVTLILGTPMNENEQYSVHVENVTDLTGNNTVGTTNVTFSSWVNNTACAGLLMEIWNGTTGPTTAGTFGGNAIQDILNHPAYPNDPSETLKLVNSFDTDEVYGGNAHEGYGGRLRGLFVPPFSGAWKFTIRSDDAGRLIFNPNGPGAAGAVQAANEGGCCGVLSVNEGDPRMSVPYNLVGGRAYYIEALWKEGTGGDYCQVAAILHGGGAVGGVTNPIPKAWFGAALPPGLLGDFSITQNPQNVTTPDNTRVRFSVGTSTTVPLCYQWLRDGVEIPGANSPNYNITATQVADDNAKFSVRVSIPGGPTHESAQALLDVAEDTAGPTLTSAASALDGTTITLTFSEPLDLASAQSVGNYVLTPSVLVNSAVLAANNTTVTLTTAPRAVANYSLSISGIKDRSPRLNLISPNPTVVSLTGASLVFAYSSGTWKYETNSQDATLSGTPWYSPAFSDAAWQSGQAFFGFEATAAVTNLLPAPGIVTLLPANSDVNNSNAAVTAYFRRQVTLPAVPSGGVYALCHFTDDGLVAYIDGVELLRFNMGSETPPHFTTRAATSTEGALVCQLFTAPAGAHSLAIEVHQGGVTTSDALFGAEIIALPAPPHLTIAGDETAVRLNWGGDSAWQLVQAADVAGAYTPTAGNPIGALAIPRASVTNTTFYHLRYVPR